MTEQQGPEVELKLSCRGCAHLKCEHSDRDYCYSCSHPEMLVDLGYTPKTPPTCPLWSAAIAVKMKTLGFVPAADVERLRELIK